jgi:TPR repeat protein
MSRGYVYILFNSAMPDLVKIGQTAGLPEERAKALSSETGVPLRFSVAWQAELVYFEEAEREIHSQLDSFRANKRREFFALPLRDAIKAAEQVVKKYLEQEASPTQANYPDDLRQDVTAYLQALNAQLGDHFLRSRAYDRIERWKETAVAGLAAPQHLYGLCLYRGIGAKKNLEEAMLWIRRAADRGYMPACTSMGSLCSLGRGVPADDAQSVMWFRKAAEKGYAPAQFLLAMMYLQGRGLIEDPGQALGWLSAAADKRYPSAEWMLAGLKGDHDGMWVKLRDSAEKGNPMAQVTIGTLFEKGEGVPADKFEAAAWYARAARQRNDEAERMLFDLCTRNGGPSSPTFVDQATSDSPACLIMRRENHTISFFGLNATERCSIGRATNCRIVLRDDLASREHAVIRYADGRWILRDLASLNGTRVNDIIATEDQELDCGDELQIGSTRFLFVREPAE